MRDLDIERHLNWAERLLWVCIISFVVALFAFVMYGLVGLPAWVWWSAWPLLGVALLARAGREHHRREVQELLRRSYQEPWWLGIDKPLRPTIKVDPDGRNR